MNADTKTIDRITAYAKSIGFEGEVCVKSIVQPMIRRKEGIDGYDYEGIANTDDVDLEGEVVRPDGADKDYLDANRSMFADHKYGTMDVVGKIRVFKRIREGGRHRAWQVKFKLATTEMGLTTAKIIDELGGIGLSVGFIAREYGPPTAEEKTLYTKGGKSPHNIIRSWEWFELSTTALPANKACQTAAVTYDEKYAADVERLVTKGTITRAGASKLGLPITAERKVFAVNPRRVILPDGSVVVRRA